MNEEVGFGLDHVAVGRQSDRWGQIMDVGMLAQITGPGLQHADHADLAANEAWVACAVLEGGGRGPKKERIDLLLMALGNFSQFGWYGKGDHEIGYGEQEILLPRLPGLGRVLFAARTVAIAAGVVPVAHGRAGRAGVALPAQHRSTTGFDCRHRRKMTGQHPVRALLAVGWPRAPEDRAERGHGRPAVICSSAAPAWTSALRVRWG